MEAGAALLAVKRERLYVAYGTFESYCHQRWRIERQHAYRLVDAAEVTAIVSPTGDIPASEWVARELVPLKKEPTRLLTTWRALVAQLRTRPTASVVHQAVANVRAMPDLPIEAVVRQAIAETRRDKSKRPRRHPIVDEPATASRNPAVETYLDAIDCIATTDPDVIFTLIPSRARARLDKISSAYRHLLRLNSLRQSLET